MDAAVVRDQEADAVLNVVFADHGLVGGLDALDEDRLVAALAVGPAFSRHDMIPVQGFSHLPRRQIQVLAAFVGAQEAVAVGMGDDAAGDQIHLVRRAVSVAAVADNLAVARHGPQAAAQRRFLLGACQAEVGGDVGQALRGAGGAQAGEDLLAFGDRHRVGGGRRGVFRCWFGCGHGVCCRLQAEVAELVDALASGASGGNPVEVQVLSSAPFMTPVMRRHARCRASAPSSRIVSSRSGPVEISASGVSHNSSTRRR